MVLGAPTLWRADAHWVGRAIRVILFILVKRLYGLCGGGVYFWKLGRNHV